MVDSINGNNYSYTIVRGDNLTKIARKNNTTIEKILELNPQIADRNKIYAGRQLILPDNKTFKPKEDYNANKLNIGTATVDGKEISEIGGKQLSSNYYGNNLSALSSQTVNDNNPATKIVIEIQAGKSMSDKDGTPYSILNKVVMDHIDNTTTVATDAGKRSVKGEKLENTDLYKAFISEDVNGDNFTGENNRLLSRGESGNKVQIPSVEVDSNGTKYFTLHGKNDEILYFDSTGKKVSFENGVISGAAAVAEQPAVKAEAEGQALQAPGNQELLVRKDNKDNYLNLGQVFVNGQIIDSADMQSNFYRNNVNTTFAKASLNDNSNATRLDIQLNMGSQINTRDTSASDILKKLLGNNFDKASQTVKDGDGYKTVNTKLTDTDLYSAFMQVNGENFADGKLVRNESGVNTIQIPALEADANGVEYYTLHTTDRILYFNNKGESIQPQT